MFYLITICLVRGMLTPLGVTVANYGGSPRLGGCWGMQYLLTTLLLYVGGYVPRLLLAPGSKYSLTCFVWRTGYGRDYIWCVHEWWCGVVCEVWCGVSCMVMSVLPKGGVISLKTYSPHHYSNSTVSGIAFLSIHSAWDSYPLVSYSHP